MYKAQSPNPRTKNEKIYKTFNPVWLSWLSTQKQQLCPVAPEWNAAQVTHMKVLEYLNLQENSLLDKLIGRRVCYTKHCSHDVPVFRHFPWMGPLITEMLALSHACQPCSGLPIPDSSGFV
jgi:hypothetical protein